jgi:hypothetical protein
VERNGGEVGLGLDLPRLEYLGQSIEYRHLMLIQVGKVESVYVDLKSVKLFPDIGLWDQYAIRQGRGSTILITYHPVIGVPASLMRRTVGDGGLTLPIDPFKPRMPFNPLTSIIPQSPLSSHRQRPLSNSHLPSASTWPSIGP